VSESVFRAIPRIQVTQPLMYIDGEIQAIRLPSSDFTYAVIRVSMRTVSRRDTLQ